MDFTLLQSQAAPENMPYLAAAFVLTGAVLLGYALFMAWRANSLAREIRASSPSTELPRSRE
ncbi:MAG: hypothetical protein FJ316_03380 [SAR202 cluster bacterium]|nr:hypothetical protein [SAR202 cluster bacterium]